MWFNGCFPNLPCPLPLLPGLCLLQPMALLGAWEGSCSHWGCPHATSSHGHGKVSVSPPAMAMGRSLCHLLPWPWEGLCVTSTHGHGKVSVSPPAMAMMLLSGTKRSRLQAPEKDHGLSTVSDTHFKLNPALVRERQQQQHQ